MTFIYCDYCGIFIGAYSIEELSEHYEEECPEMRRMRKK